MKALEFKSLLKNKSIKIPDNLGSKLPENKNVRVIVLYEEQENQEENDFKLLAEKEFLSGYSESDSIYDNE